MKLDTSHMRYLTTDDFRVLQAVEQGSKNHEVVPTPLIHQISGMRSQSGTNRAISDLAKLSLISKMRNIKYDGYRLTYNGIDYLALKTMLNRNTVYSVGNTIGVGKESDIYKVSDKNGNPRVMKIHRLGRTSFHSVRNNRDYLKNSNQGANWMHLSRLAANKEYQFMSMLYSKGFKVPEPFDNSRHIVVMELIEGYPMRRLRKHKNIPKLYSDLMCFVVELANSGLIHCDFNEFNIMVKDKVEDEQDCGFVVIDFPQCVSIQHQDADYYFQRDVDCIRRFFKKKLKYEPKSDSSMLDTEGFGDGYRYAYPEFKRDIKRSDNLDELVQASGFSKKHPGDRSLEIAVESMRNTVYASGDDISNEEAEDGNEEGDYSEEEEFYDSEVDNESSGDDSEDPQEEENERIIEALSSGVENLKMDKLGNYILE
ncbi:RIO2-like protein [Saccharomyces kudriavzevii IFO 1802]|uniref:Serine/threonine-protein kinase RIO2 n=1 Tax=Saccharomyces kudriavzevii (strain ATCC MYA-4449 / AS 2.2408 / CBS 8840 / NBRC 1802 / NCYC 2889) TaxID=226230 RepID=J4U4F5_SACK1|nr:RIO2-like protein [Saccharomyces kudriavzevii IFO 1802]